MKLWLCGITSAGNYENLREMIEPILEYFDGLVWTFHEPVFNDDHTTDTGFSFLMDSKKEGKIIVAEWTQRHFNSMNQFLWQGPMQEGDFFIVLDTMERISPDFCQKILPQLIEQMKKNNVQVVQNYGKGFLFRYSEILEFKGSPHWYATMLDGAVMNMELEKPHFWNVRNEQREPFQFVKHYLKYYLYPAGSNHCLLGLEKNGDPQKLFPERELRRLRFRKYLTKYGIKLEPDAVINHFIEQKEKPLAELLQFVNDEKILNDVWRYYILKDENFKDDHNFEDMVKI